MLSTGRIDLPVGSNRVQISENSDGLVQVEKFWRLEFVNGAEISCRYDIKFLQQCLPTCNLAFYPYQLLEQSISSTDFNSKL
jgi:hypothetical protein